MSGYLNEQDFNPSEQEYADLVGGFFATFGADPNTLKPDLGTHVSYSSLGQEEEEHVTNLPQEPQNPVGVEQIANPSDQIHVADDQEPTDTASPQRDCEYRSVCRTLSNVVLDMYHVGTADPNTLNPDLGTHVSYSSLGQEEEEHVTNLPQEPQNPVGVEQIADPSDQIHVADDQEPTDTASPQRECEYRSVCRTLSNVVLDMYHVGTADPNTLNPDLGTHVSYSSLGQEEEEHVTNLPQEPQNPVGVEQIADPSDQIHVADDQEPTDTASPQRECEYRSVCRTLSNVVLDMYHVGTADPNTLNPDLSTHVSYSSLGQEQIADPSDQIHVADDQEPTDTASPQRECEYRSVCRTLSNVVLDMYHVGTVGDDMRLQGQAHIVEMNHIAFVVKNPAGSLKMWIICWLS
ncbi:hypothetical protein LINGRAHAP2_LOCUS17430 [Linum grandiflorum]